MQKSLTIIASLTAASLSFTALATPSWRYVEGGYSTMDFDGNGNFDPDGFTVASKYLLNENVYLNGELRYLEEGNFDATTQTLGAGYRMPLNSTTDAFFGANFERVDTDGGDETGYSINAGVRSMVTDQIELAGQVGYYDLDDGEATLKLGANYYFTPRWAVGVSWETIDDADITQVTARYTF